MGAACLAIFGALVILSTVTVEAMPSKSAVFLYTYGYMERNPEPNPDSIANSDYEDGMREFQKRMGLNVTGVYDNATKALMDRPRCGMPDYGPLVSGTAIETRVKRYMLQGSSWPRNELTYHITDYGNQTLTNAQIDDAIRRGFDAWTRHANLQFREVAVTETADIEIFFRSGDHEDGSNFDGSLGVLAHAFFPVNNGNDPLDGDAHFDDAEVYTIDAPAQTQFDIDLVQVAAHEFGHSLGLAHSQYMDALMGPFFSGYQPNFDLHPDDIAAIQALYGPPGETPAPPPTDATAATAAPGAQTPIPSSNYCEDSQVDAVTTTADGKTYFFRGEHYLESEYDFDRERIVLASGPRLIAEDWPGLEGDLDAAVTYGTSTYFFKGSDVWTFRNQVPLRDRLPISRLVVGLPSDIDAAFQWSGNGALYFVKDDQYWRLAFNGQLARGYPRPMTNWDEELTDVTEAFQWINGFTYFFRRDNYYRYNDGAFRVDAGYPAHTGDVWLGCLEDLIGGLRIQIDSSANNGTASDNNNVKFAKEAAMYTGDSVAVKPLSVMLLVVFAALSWNL